MKKLYPAAWLLFVFLIFIPGPLLAMVDTEGIVWRSDNPTVFINSVYQSALGRDPTPAEDARARQVRSKIRIFWEVVSKQEYKNMFPNLEVAYNIYVHSKWTRTPTGGLERMCNCYYLAKSSSDHCTAGPYTFPIARAVVLMTNAFDMDACPFFECGFSTLGQDPDEPITPARGNLVLDPNFANFGSPNGPWGRNVLYGQYGIWWNSNHAQSNAGRVTFSDGQTALYIKNQSGISPHVFGTTAQRIKTDRGRQYEISFLGSARNLASNGAVFIVVDPQWKVRPINMPGGTYQWRTFSGRFTAQSDYIDLRIVIADRGEAWITRMTLKPIQ